MRNNRGFTLIELLVVIAIIGVLAAILIPNILGAIRDAKKTADTANLKELIKQYVAGQAKKLRGPRSVGHRFWVALLAGDGAALGTAAYTVSTTGTSTDVYMSSGDVGVLCSPADDVIQKEQVKNSIAAAVAGNQGASAATIDWCSYAGPAGVAGLNGYLTLSKPGGGIVGCTGSRNNVGYFPDGMSVVRSNAEAEFVSWEKAMKPLAQGGYAWPANTVAPNYGVAPLLDVLRYQ